MLANIFFKTMSQFVSETETTIPSSQWPKAGQSISIAQLDADEYQAGNHKFTILQSEIY